MLQLFLNGICAIFLCSGFFISHAYAQHNVEKLTENNINDFVQDVTNKANQVTDLGYENASLFFSRHLHPEAFFKSVIQYNIPGYPSQENKMTYDKEQYINTLLSSDQSVNDFEAQVDIKNIKISRDKRKATLQTLTTENAIMEIPQGNETEYVSVIGYSKCDQIVMLSDSNVIQIYSANCTTEMEFE